MEKSTPQIQEGNATRLIEDINQLQLIALGEGAVICVVCGSEIREGERLAAYVFRSAGRRFFEIGYVWCGGVQRESVECFTLGVEEVVVEGRVGRCSDVVLQESWPVLLDPVVVAVSAAATRTARRVNPSDSSGVGEGDGTRECVACVSTGGGGDE